MIPKVDDYHGICGLMVSFVRFGVRLGAEPMRIINAMRCADAACCTQYPSEPSPLRMH